MGSTSRSGLSNCRFRLRTRASSSMTTGRSLTTLCILKKCCAAPRCLVRLCAVKTDADLAWQLFCCLVDQAIHKTRSSASTLPTKLVNSLDAASAKKSATPTTFVRSGQTADLVFVRTSNRGMKQGDDFKVLKPHDNIKHFPALRFDILVASQIRGCSSQATDWDLMLIKRATGSGRQTG